MKKFLIVVLIVMLVLALMAGCRSAKEKAAEEMAEEMLEEMLEGMADEDGNDVDIDFEGDEDGGSMTISSGDEEIVIEGDEDGIPWPSGDLPANVPELKGVKVIAKQLMGPVVVISFEGCDEGKATAYVEAIKAKGWEIVMETTVEEGYQLMAENADDEVINFTWSSEDGMGVMSFASEE